MQKQYIAMMSEFDPSSLTPGALALEESLHRYVISSAPTISDHQQRLQLIQTINRTLNEQLPGFQQLYLLPFGSFVSGLYRTTSDIDLCLTGLVARTAIKPRFHSEIDPAFQGQEFIPLSALGKDFKGVILRSIGEILKRNRIAKPMSIHFILHARVPIISFVDNAQGIECDLSISSDTAQFKAAFVRSLVQIDPRFEPLYRVIKAWAKAHNLNDGSRSTFNSWCLLLIFISYLQSQKCPGGGVLLPKLKDLFFAEDEEPESRILSPDSKYDPGEALKTAGVRAMGAKLEFKQRRSTSPPLIELFKVRSYISSAQSLPDPRTLIQGVSRLCP